MAGRILVVDDVEQNVRLLEAKLTSEYYTVYSAMSGIEALEKVKTYSPDVILLDVMMPEMDGFEVCERLRNDIETAHIPVVMVTALSEQKDRVRGLSVGATDFITKPIDEVHLFARVKSLIRMKLMLDELRMRDKTGSEFGLKASEAIINSSDATGHILVVNDDIIEAQNIQKALEKDGHEITVNTDPEETHKFTEETTFDMVILSSMLDDVDGLRLGVEILSQEQNRQLPLMMIVDEDEKPVIVRALEIGIDDYVTSPIDNNELTARVHTLITRKKYQDALKSNLEESVSAAAFDSLTKLYNRRYLDAHLANMVEDALKHKVPLSLMTMDIDHFKLINDRPGWGHDVGDQVLVEMASRIKESTRSTDLPTRPGGEEFVIVMPKTPGNIAEIVAERMRQRIEKSHMKINAEPGYVQCTVSIGVATLDMDGNDSAQELIKHSDEALYRAKDTGRNKVVMYGTETMSAVASGEDW